jgi:peptidoglycan hydrolase-like amidase
MGGTRNTLHVDGISEYYLDRSSGLISEHRVSHLLINDQAVRPENGVFHALAEMSPVNPDGVPVFFGTELLDQKNTNEMMKLNFQTLNPLTNLLLQGKSSTSSSLFSNPNEQAMQLPENTNGINTDSQVPYDRDALQRKNASRKKFGLPPITPEEFIKIEEEVRAMDDMNKKKAAYLAEKLSQSRKKEEKDSFLSNIFGGVLKNGCENNFDCERPQVCCDVGFKKICCSNGLGIVDGIPVEKYQRGVLRVPIPNDNVDY